jgi:hypothetical protein
MARDGCVLQKMSNIREVLKLNYSLKLAFDGLLGQDEDTF